ncbi:MAG: PspA/IM30 family protein [Cyanobacteria bacterium J06633_8]
MTNNKKESISDLRIETIKLRQDIDSARESQKLLESQYTEAQSLADKWKGCLEKAFEEGNETAASEALTNQNRYTNRVSECKIKLDELNDLISSLENDLILKLERMSKITLERDIEYLEELKNNKNSESDLITFRQKVATSIAIQKRIQMQYDNAQAEANQWYRNAMLALQREDESLARKALERKQKFSTKAMKFKPILDEVTTLVEELKVELMEIERNNSLNKQR